MAPDERLFGADRIVAFLPAATITLDDLDGHREKHIRRETEKFLKSPESAFAKHPEDHISQIKHRDSKMRAFATWCQNEDLQAELCVVHEIYRKKNEGEYWDTIDEYNEEGAEYSIQFSQIDTEQFQDWKAKIRDDADTLVLES